LYVPSLCSINYLTTTGDFTATAFGRTIWGSASDKASLEADLAQARGNFTSIPLLIGEFATPPPSTETAARWKWYDFIVRTALKYDTSVMLWDAGGSFALDAAGAWSGWVDPSAVNIIYFASSGIPNLLAESTTDPDAASQSSSAFIFHKKGDVVQDTTLSFIWNETMPKDLPLWLITSVVKYNSSENRNLVQDTDYVINGTNITFKASYLSTLFSNTGGNGFKANITLQCTRGANLRLQAYQWAPPTLGAVSSTIKNETAQNDLAIPISWQGKPQLATVKAQMLNGSYLVDTWTQWLGPLQRGRIVFLLSLLLLCPLPRER
jgi:endoglucanase